MKLTATSRLLITSILGLLLPLSGCQTMNDQQFAAATMANDTSKALSLIQPHSGQMKITGKSGRSAYPIQFAVQNGNKALTYALIENGSPTTFDGGSLAYWAGYCEKNDLARDLASNGYGSYSDVSGGKRQKAAERERVRKDAAMGNAVMLGVAAALLGGSGGGSGGETCGKCYGDGLMHIPGGVTTCNLCGGDGVR